MENQYIKFTRRDNCLIGEYKVDKIDFEIAKTVVDFRIGLQKGEKMAAIVVADKLVAMDKEARDYLSGEKGVQNLVAGALVVNSSFRKNLFSLVLKFTKPLIPNKIFTDLDEAVEWAQSYME